LRGINVEPTNGPTRALYRMGLGRRAAFLSDLSVRFL